MKSKSLGILLRLAGVINLLRNAAKSKHSEEIPVYDDSITKVDFGRALQVVRYSIETSFAIVKVNKKIGVTKHIINSKNKEPVPAEAENCSMDYLIANARVTKRIQKKSEISVSAITRDKIYPHVGDDSGAHIARKFLNGLVVLGFGELVENSKIFKRYHPDDDSCPHKDDLRQKWATLQIPLN